MYPLRVRKKSKKTNGEHVGYEQTIRRKIVRSSLTRYEDGSKYIFHAVRNPLARPVCRRAKPHFRLLSDDQRQQQIRVRRPRRSLIALSRRFLPSNCPRRSIGRSTAAKCAVC